MRTPAAAKGVVASAFDRRAARAESLARNSSAAEEALRFAAGLFRAQGRMAAALENAAAGAPFRGHLQEDAGRLSDASAHVLRYAAEEGPEALSEEARTRQKDTEETARTRLLVFWAGDRGADEDYLSLAVLRPYVELLRSVNMAPDRVHRRGQCPFCSSAPAVSVRRDAGESEGARRLLGCPLCGLEWHFQRILCPACFEEDPYRLPSFQNERYPGVRIEACETCRRYVKSIDLSLDARPIPEVDDLASLSMDLWASGEGYTRVHPGWAGL